MAAPLEDSLAGLFKIGVKLNPENLAFFQQPRKSVQEIDDVWYTKKPLGHNTLDNMMKRIFSQSSLTRTYTNHRVRATTVTLLSHASVEAREIVKITGHKNTQSLSSYNTDSSAAQRRQYSAIMQNSSRSQFPPSSTASVNPSQFPPSSTASVNLSQTITQGITSLFQIGNSNIVIHNHFQN